MALAALALAGCGQNAFFEVDVILPVNDTGQKRYAVIAFAPAGQDYDAVWAGNQTLPGVLLSASDTISQHASVEGTSERFEQVVEAKVTFCGDQTCTAKGDDRAPEVRLRIERAFYEGKRTSYAWKIACIPTADKPDSCQEKDRTVREVTRCEVAGCRDGISTSYCVGDRHFCEE